MNITVEISDDDAMHINKLIERANLHDRGANTHGKLSFEVLGQMLMQDVALAVRRPGSWEGASMGQLLSSHGYW